MAIYTVHVPTGDARVRADGTAFVRDGFSVAAFLFGPLYLLRHRAWLAAAGWLVGVLAIAAACALLNLPLGAEIALAALIMLFTGLEASSVRRLSLHRRGLDAAGVVSASTLEEGEVAFFRSVGGSEAAAMPAAAGVRRRPAPTGIIGLFPEAEA